MAENRAVGTQFIQAERLEITANNYLFSYTRPNSMGFSSSLPTSDLPFNLTMIMSLNPGDQKCTCSIITNDATQEVNSRIQEDSTIGVQRWGRWLYPEEIEAVSTKEGGKLVQEEVMPKSE